MRVRAPSRSPPDAAGALCLWFQVVHLRQRLDNTVTSSRDRTLPIDASITMIHALIDCDEFQDIATLRVSNRGSNCLLPTAGANV